MRPATTDAKMMILYFMLARVTLFFLVDPSGEPGENEDGDEDDDGDAAEW